HGVGRLFHDEPNIVHVGRPGEGIVLRPGMFFTVEPMINLGRPHVKVLSDGWTAVTRDRSLSAQFEHTVAVAGGCVGSFLAAAPRPRPAAPIGAGINALPSQNRTERASCSRCASERAAQIHPCPAATNPRKQMQRRITTDIATACASGSCRAAAMRSTTTKC